MLSDIGHKRLLLEEDMKKYHYMDVEQEWADLMFLNAYIWCMTGKSMINVFHIFILLMDSWSHRVATH